MSQPTPSHYRFAMTCPVCGGSGDARGGGQCRRCQGNGLVARPNKALRALLVALPVIVLVTVLMTLMVDSAFAASPRATNTALACAPLTPTGSAAPPFVDDMGDLSKTTAHSTYWASDQEHSHDIWFADPRHPSGDPTRLERYPSKPDAPLGAEWFYYHVPGARRFTETIWHQAGQGNVIVDEAWTDETTNVSLPGGFAWHVTPYALSDTDFTLTQKGWGYANITLVVPADRTAQDVLFSFDAASTAGAQWANEVGYSEVDF